MSDEETVSDVLFRHSDERVCRLLWQSIEEDAARPPLDEQIEVMRATDGAVSLLVQDPVVEVYARWHEGRFEQVSISPPWHVVDYDRGGRAMLREALDGEVDPRPLLHEKTPFASGSLSLDDGPGP
ncbi:MAG: hypothetical protein ABEJ23_08890 [Haloarculaceae archaeon]